MAGRRGRPPLPLGGLGDPLAFPPSPALPRAGPAAPGPGGGPGGLPPPRRRARAPRGLARALLDAGAEVALSARRPPAPGEPAIARVGWRSAGETDALARATVLVNATPLAGAQEPLAPAGIPRRALVVDLVYGEGV